MRQLHAGQLRYHVSCSKTIKTRGEEKRGGHLENDRNTKITEFVSKKKIVESV